MIVITGTKWGTLISYYTGFTIEIKDGDKYNKISSQVSKINKMANSQTTADFSFRNLLSILLPSYLFQD